MTEGGGSRKVRKTGSPKGRRKSEVGSPKSEEFGVAKSEIENPTSEITKMEVHHHPEVEKKGFKEYILEGMMIFLAVTMGFFAESLREHINEHDRAKEYATTLISDLKADTTDLKLYIKKIDFAAHNIDTLMNLLSSADPKDIPSGKLYWYGLFGGLHSTFIPNDVTLLEMKSSGSLRYFSKPSLNRLLANTISCCKALGQVNNCSKASTPR